ncbi:MAG: hypothetical protein ACYS8W_02325 [Planctomycetota bacterium]|jgi:hypothetical protein
MWHAVDFDNIFRFFGPALEGHPIVGLLCLLMGFGLLFYGVRLSRYFVMLIGVLAGTWLAFYAATSYGFSRSSVYALPFFGAIAGGLLSIPRPRVALAYISGILALFAGLRIGAYVGEMTSFALAAAAFIVVVLAVHQKFERAVIFSSSVAGAMLFIVGSCAFINHADSSLYERIRVSYSLSTMLVTIGVAVFGMMYQEELYRVMEPESEGGPDSEKSYDEDPGRSASGRLQAAG